MIALAGVPRPAPRTDQDTAISPLDLCHDSWRARWRGVRVNLTGTEFLIVCCLATEAGGNRPYWYIYQMARGGKCHAAYKGDPHVAVRSHIKRIRAKFRAIDPGFDRIENCCEFGYRWRETA